MVMPDKDHAAFQAWKAVAVWLSQRTRSGLHDSSQTAHSPKQPLSLPGGIASQPTHVARICQLVLGQLEAGLRARCIPNFTQLLSDCSSTAAGAVVAPLEAALEVLTQALSRDVGVLEELQASMSVDGEAGSGVQDLVSVYMGRAATLLRNTAPVNLKELLALYLRAKLTDLQHMTAVTLDRFQQAATDAAPDRPPLHARMEQDSSAGLDPAWLGGLMGVARTLDLVHLEAVALDALMATIRHHMHAAVSNMDLAWLECRALQGVEEYLLAVPLRLLGVMLPSLIQNPTTRKETLEQCCVQLQYYVFVSVGCWYVEHMFEVFRDYPATTPAVTDCAECLKRASLHDHFLATVCNSVQLRLLHPGAATENIIDSYINVIRVMQKVDRSGALTEAVAAPIRSYLRCRPDTIRCVVKLLTQEDTEAPGESALSEMKAEEVDLCGACDFDDLEGHMEALRQAMDWKPPAIELDIPHLRSAGTFDILATLLAIYGNSIELFIAEFKRMLGANLVKKANFLTDFETQTLELLKLRFKENELHHCSVMLKDVQHSRRHMQTLLDPDGGSTSGLRGLQPHFERVSMLICSHLFWPKMPAADIDLNLPEWLQASMDAHSKAFRHAKAPRKLSFAKGLGTVYLDLEIGHVLQHFQVSPVLATIIVQFEDVATLSALELSRRTNIPMPVLLRKALFWVQHGALAEERGHDGSLHYRRNEHLPDSFVPSEGIIADDGDDDEAQDDSQGAAASKEHSMAKYLHIVKSVLSSVKKCPLARLQKLMLIFGAHTNPKYDRGVADLAEYLDSLVERNVLSRSGNTYSLTE